MRAFWLPVWLGLAIVLPLQAAGQNLRIRDASYEAKDGRRCDAGTRVRAACEGKVGCEIDVGNRLCGDPAKATYKELVVRYDCGGRRYEARVPEEELMTLSCENEPAGGRSAGRGGGARGSDTDGTIHVRGASYQALDGRRCDAGRQVRATCEGNASCEVSAGNGLCGDPARATYKELIVSYQCGRDRHEARVPEGERAVLSCTADSMRGAWAPGHRPGGNWSGGNWSGGNWSGGHGSSVGGPLQISDAAYRAWDGRSCNPENRIRQACQGRQSCTVEANDRLCGDPAEASRKELVVGYVCGGERREARVPEGSSVNLTCN
jgi:hypothetical protein